jgi:hypothetical protein
MKFLNFFLLLWVIFCIPESGTTNLIESGSETLEICSAKVERLRKWRALCSSSCWAVWALQTGVLVVGGGGVEGEGTGDENASIVRVLRIKSQGRWADCMVACMVPSSLILTLLPAWYPGADCLVVCMIFNS